MSNWCQSHPTYSAKREPNSICGECWKLWLYRCPEAKIDELTISRKHEFTKKDK